MGISSDGTVEMPRPRASARQLPPGEGRDCWGPARLPVACGGARPVSRLGRGGKAGPSCGPAVRVRPLPGFRQSSTGPALRIAILGPHPPDDPGPGRAAPRCHTGHGLPEKRGGPESRGQRAVGGTSCWCYQKPGLAAHAPQPALEGPGWWGRNVCFTSETGNRGGGQTPAQRPLCDPIDCSLPGSSIHGIPQARILEWVAMPFSRGSS